MNEKLLLDIAHTYGTPVYVYDLSKIKQKLNLLKNYFQNLNTEIHYAVKANANEHILKFFLNEHAGLDCVSTEEIKHALHLGFEPKEILYTPSCPSHEELAFAMDKGVRVHLSAIEYLPWLAGRYPGAEIGLRINPGIFGGGNKKIATAHSASKFGIHWSEKDRLLEWLDKLPLKITGLHIHAGSDVSDWQILARSFDFLLENSNHFPHLKYLDLGSGFKIRYKPGDRETDLQAYADYIENKLQDRRLKIVLEPGKYLVSESGVFLMKVNVVKKAGEKLFAGVNTGFNHFIRPMYYGAWHEIVNLSNLEGKLQKYDVVGNLCEEDTFAYDRMIPEIRPGDILALKNAGAYGYSMTLAHYNLRPLPNQIVIDGERIIED